MKDEEQLDEWVKGNPIHNKEKDICCPDFSCCRGKENIADKEVRERFAKAYYAKDEETQNQMLMMFLGSLLNDSNIYIAGDSSISNRTQ